MTIGRFNAGIGALIWNPATQRYLLLRRGGQRDFGAGSWDCVTGRVDQGESFEQAVHREVMEEIGGRVQIDFVIGTTHFYRGPELPEYELLGVLYACTILNPDEISRGEEHSEMGWYTVGEAREFLSPHNWLRRTIEGAELLRLHLPAEVRQYYLTNAFVI